MARTYYIDGPVTAIDGDPLDAWTARVRIQTNAEAIYEEARDDGRIVMSAYQEMPNTYTCWGPVPIRLRRDRNGLWRTQYVDLLFAAGGFDDLRVRAVITDTYRAPYYDGFPVLIVGDIDPYAEWTVATGSVPDWLGATAITLPRNWNPSIVERGDADDRGTMRIAWLTVWIMDEPTGDDPRICGCRHYESVADEP